MLNHVRTLLLNLSSDGMFQEGYLAEELVPEYTALAVPAPLQPLRRLLFGADPDRHFLNYRVRQLLTLVHASPLAPYVTVGDTRITYAVGGADESLVARSAFAPLITTVGGGGVETLEVSGTPTAPDASGRVVRQFIVEIESGTTLSVQQDHPSQKEVFEFGLSNGLSNFVPLGDSGHTCAVRTATPGSLWQVVVKNRPRWDPGQLAVNLTLVGKDVFDFVFGPDLVEPWATFRNAWELDPDLPSRLAGLILGIVYRTDRIRLGLD